MKVNNLKVIITRIDGSIVTGMASNVTVSTVNLKVRSFMSAHCIPHKTIDSITYEKV